MLAAKISVAVSPATMVVRVKAIPAYAQRATMAIAARLPLFQRYWAPTIAQGAIVLRRFLVRARG